MADCVARIADVDVLLRSCQCQGWFAALYYLGVRRVQDIMELHDNDLALMGMDTVSMRKLQRALYEYSACQWPASEEPPAALIDSATATCTFPFSHGEYEGMCEASRKAEMESIDNLDEVLEADIRDIGDIRAMALIAKKKLRLLESAFGPHGVGKKGIRVGIEAENATSRAILTCHPKISRTSPLFKALEQALRKIRDVIVLRTQMACSDKTRDTFMKTLRDAYGEPLQREHEAKLMVAHKKVVPPIVKDIFLSKSAIVNLQKPHGPRMKRTRDLKRLEQKKVRDSGYSRICIGVAGWTGSEYRRLHQLC